MSPRKARYRVDEYIVAEHRQKGQKLLSGPYLCPICGKESLRILIKQDSKEVRARCKCGFNKNVIFIPKHKAIDYYNDIIDKL
ncbi:MAG: hypothetical protein ACTSQY_04140 [Candidatus Odinarchaeia archaeon]